MSDRILGDNSSTLAIPTRLMRTVRVDDQGAMGSSTCFGVVNAAELMALTNTWGPDWRVEPPKKPTPKIVAEPLETVAEKKRRFKKLAKRKVRS